MQNHSSKSNIQTNNASKSAKKNTSQQFQKRLKAIGHQLAPVVTVGNQGITPNLLEEVGRALNDHELIKIKLPAGSKADRQALAQSIVEACEAQLVQTLGRMALIFRKNPQPNAKLSNLARHGL